MPKYKYLLTAEIEIEAENIMAAETAVTECRYGRRMINVSGPSYTSFRMPSQQSDFTSARISIDKGTITRLPKVKEAL